MKYTISFIILLAFFMAFGGTSLARHNASHAYTNYMRAGEGTSIFIQQDVQGEFGRYTNADGHTDWKGYGIGTNLGLEVNRFIEFTAGHTLVNLKHDRESLGGSRLEAGGRLQFLSPIGNLELGGGLQGSKLDYQNLSDTGTYYGSGRYYSLGLNYFMTSQVSIYFESDWTGEHFVRSGDAKTDFDAESTLMGLGFRVYL